MKSLFKKFVHRAKISCMATSLLVTAGASLPVQAETSFPVRPVTLVVPFAPGGSTDVVARLIGAEASKALGQSVVIENRAGAAGVIGAQHVARSSPDGYTLCFCGGGPTLILKLLDPGLAYDPATDFVPVTLTHITNFIMAVDASSPYKTLEDVVNAAKERSDNLSYGSTGVGGPAHLGMESFNKVIDATITHVPYKGESQMIVDLLGGRLDIGALSFQLAESLLSEGKIHPIAVWSTERSPLFEDVPAVAESYPGFETSTFVGITAPTGTPDSVVMKIQQAFTKAVNEPEVQEKLISMGFTPRGTTSAEYVSFLETEHVKWKSLIDELQISLR